MSTFGKSRTIFGAELLTVSDEKLKAQITVHIDLRFWHPGCLPLVGAFVLKTYHGCAMQPGRYRMRIERNEWLVNITEVNLCAKSSLASGFGCLELLAEDSERWGRMHTS